jgi:AbrB family looped-hinge helix DNA binding protein
MRNIVKVTRRGQTTIPALFRQEFGIKEGDELVVEVTKEGLLFRVIPKLEELAGSYSKYGNVEEMKQEIEKLREEY